MKLFPAPPQPPPEEKFVAARYSTFQAEHGVTYDEAEAAGTLAKYGARKVPREESLVKENQTVCAEGSRPKGGPE